MIFDYVKIRNDFPIFKKKINNCSLIYFDNAASSQKPYCVINKEKDFYENNYAAINRSVHTLSLNATKSVEKVRFQVAKFINASSKDEIIFVKGATEGINLVVNTFGKQYLKKGDNIIISEMEHHANIVPWQILSKDIQFEIRILPINIKGELNIKKLSSLINKKTRIISFVHISNVLGTINNVKKIVKIAKKFNIKTLIDGSQAIMHEKIDVQDINCDFYVFSGHKIYGPTGIGILYGRKKILKKMSPWQGGGSMITEVSLKNDPIFSQVPWKFEAGSLNSAGILGLGSALKYVNSIGLNNIKSYEKNLFEYCLKRLNEIPNLVIYGNAKNRAGIISFNIKDYHSYDIGNFLSQYGIAIRTGHQCAIPTMNFYKVSSMCRISFAFYNNIKEIDYMIFSLNKILNLLKL